MTLEHGQHSIIVKDNVIYIKLVGSFNEYGAKALFSEVKEVINTFNGCEFAIIADFLEFQGATPEGFDEANSYNEWLYDKGIKAKAIVTNSAALRNIDKQRVPAQKMIKTEFFNHINDAALWLQQL